MPTHDAGEHELLSHIQRVYLLLLVTCAIVGGGLISHMVETQAEKTAREALQVELATKPIAWREYWLDYSRETYRSLYDHDGPMMVRLVIVGDGGASITYDRISNGSASVAEQLTPVESPETLAKFASLRNRNRHWDAVVIEPNKQNRTVKTIRGEFEPPWRETFDSAYPALARVPDVRTTLPFTDLREWLLRQVDEHYHDVTILGFSISIGALSIAGSLLVIALYWYFYLNFANLAALAETMPSNRFPWIALYPGAPAQATFFGSAVIFPVAVVVAGGVSTMYHRMGTGAVVLQLLYVICSVLIAVAVGRTARYLWQELPRSPATVTS